MKFAANTYYLFVTLFIVFPSSLFSPLKITVLLLLLISMLGVISLGKISKKDFLLLLFTFLFLLVHLLVGFFKGTVLIEQSLMAFRVFSTFFILLFITYYYGKKKVISFSKLIKVVFYSSFIYLILKLLLTICMMFFGLGAITVKNLMPGVVIQQFYGNPFFTRIVSASDIVNSFLFVFLLVLKPLKQLFNNKVLYTYIVLSFILMIQSYTRFIWLILLLTVFFKLYILSENRVKSFSYTAFFLLITIAIVKTFFSTELGFFIDLLDIKFSDTTSISVKSVQANYLFDEFSNNTILGKGLGAYVEYYVRDNKQLFQYETQIVSFLMQFGIIGFCIFMFPLLAIIIPLLSKNKNKLTMSFFYILWLASGFTNPYLTILACISIYALFILYPYYENEDNKKEV